MKLREIAKDLENRQVFGYKPDGNTVTAHRWKVYHIAENLYMTEMTAPKNYGEPHAHVCAFFPGVKIGFDLGTICRWQINEYNETDVLDMCAWCSSPEKFIASLEKRMQEGKWLKNSEIAFVKQFDPEAANRMTAYHDEKSREREEKNEERREAAQKREEEERAERERITAEKIADAERIIKTGKRLENESVFGKSLLNLVLDRNEIPVPIRTRGWISERLKTVQVVPECRSISVSFIKKSANGKASETVYSLVWDLYKKLTA